MFEVSVMDKKPIRITKKELYKGDDGHKVFSIRIKEDVVNKLDHISIKTNRTRNEIINIFLDYAVNNWELEE